jgi:hypothetical protein
MERQTISASLFSPAILPAIIRQSRSNQAGEWQKPGFLSRKAAQGRCCGLLRNGKTLGDNNAPRSGCIAGSGFVAGSGKLPAKRGDVQSCRSLPTITVGNIGTTAAATIRDARSTGAVRDARSMGPIGNDGAIGIHGRVVTPKFIGTAASHAISRPLAATTARGTGSTTAGRTTATPVALASAPITTRAAAIRQLDGSHRFGHAPHQGLNGLALHPDRHPVHGYCHNRFPLLMRDNFRA